MDNFERDIQRYLDRLESQHKTKPKFMATTTAILEKLDPAHAVAKQLPREFYVYDAVGDQLDVIGRLVGIDRKFPPVNIPGLPVYLDDETYRKVILSQIVRNQWDGSYERFREIWDATLRGILDATYYDNQDMSMDVFVKGQTPPTLVEMILRGYIIPKPMGVRMTLNIAEEVESDANASFKPTVGVLAWVNAGRIGFGYPYQKERDPAEAEVLAGARAAANVGRMKVLYPYSTYTEADSTAMAGAAPAANIGRTKIRCPYATYTEANLTAQAGARAAANAARARIPMRYLREQQETDEFACGIKASANIARVAVTIH